MANTKKQADGSPIRITRDLSKVIVKGILTDNKDKPGYKGKGGLKRNISIKMERPLNDAERKELSEICHTSIEDKYCPHAIKEDKEYFTVRTMYNIPVQDSRGNELSIDEVGLGSEVRLSCKLKESAIYPVAMKVDVLEVYNPFDDFD